MRIAQAFQTISGNTTITSFGSNCVVGIRKTLVFSGVLTLTHNAASLIIPGGLSKATANGDVVEAVYLGSGNWRVVNYVPIAGTVVASIDGLTGIFTTGGGLRSTGNVLQLSAGRQTLPTRQIFTSGSGTYTPPANVLYIRVRMAAGGGGGGGSGSTGAGVGGTGGTTTFGAFTANGGVGGAGGGVSINTGGAGGTASGCAINLPGSQGGLSISATASTVPGGFGGGSALFHGGAGHIASGGVSGGGAGAGLNGGAAGGSGGGGGGSCEGWINSPGSISYAVGASGTAGAAGSGGSAGLAGGPGLIIVEEFYN